MDDTRRWNDPKYNQCLEVSACDTLLAASSNAGSAWIYANTCLIALFASVWLCSGDLWLYNFPSFVSCTFVCSTQEAMASHKCMNESNFNRNACEKYFKAYRECKKLAVCWHPLLVCEDHFNVLHSLHVESSTERREKECSTPKMITAPSLVPRPSCMGTRLFCTIEIWEPHAVLCILLLVSHFILLRLSWQNRQNQWFCEV